MKSENLIKLMKGLWDYKGFKISKSEDDENRFYAIYFNGLEPKVSKFFNTIDEVIIKIDNGVIFE